MAPKNIPYPVSRVEVNRLKALLIEQLDDLPSNVCLAAMMELSLTFMFAVVPLSEQRESWVEALNANLGDLPRQPSFAICQLGTSGAAG